MAKRALIILLSMIAFTPLSSQTGGDNVYEFLNLTHSGLVASLGGSNVSLPAGNLNLAWHNPALLSAGMDKNLALNYVNYLAGINYGLVLWSQSFAGKGNFAGGLAYLNYGSFTEADETGAITGSFRASEYAFSFIYSREIDSSFSAGINFKPVLSHLEKYSSFGFAFDAGVAWHSPGRLLSAGLVLRNIGFQLTSYAGEPRQKLPFEIEAGFSGKPENAPFRFSLTLRHLEKFDLTHDYSPSSAGESSGGPFSDGFLENLMRHVILGAEVIPHKNLYLSAGYNYQRKRELQIESKVSTVGFSWGFGINTTVLAVEFGRANYHLAGSSNHVSLIARPDLLYKKFRD
ncbi:MAG: type IX secretion system protein PorQ [Bacteroidales bacterium]